MRSAAAATAVATAEQAGLARDERPAVDESSRLTGRKVKVIGGSSLLTCTHLSRSRLCPSWLVPCAVHRWRTLFLWCSVHMCSTALSYPVFHAGGSCVVPCCVCAAGLGPRGYSALERLNSSGLTAADLWCLDSEPRSTAGRQSIQFRRIQVISALTSLDLSRPFRAFPFNAGSQQAQGYLCDHGQSHPCSPFLDAGMATARAATPETVLA